MSAEKGDSVHIVGVTPFCEGDRMAHITISCDTCIMDGMAACADCVVTHLLAPAPHEHPLDTTTAAATTSSTATSHAVVFDLDELRAMRVLAEAGLVPTLRHREAP